MKRVLVVLSVCLLAGVASAQADQEPAPAPQPAPMPMPPPPSPAPTDPAAALRAANDAATAGDWARVEILIQPMLARQLDRADLAEAHRLAGIAALFAQPPRRDLAEEHFLAYLRIDLDAHLDPALYPPEVVTFFNDVRVRHSAELKAARPKRRYAVLALLPPFAQFQNGERTKGWVLGGMMGTFAIANVSALLLQRRWCTPAVGPTGLSSNVCDGHVSGARAARSIQITSGVALILTYLYGVYDGVRGYRRESRERALVPFASPTNQGTVVGVQMNF